MESEIEVSARHIHLSKADYEFLFGSGAEFKEIKELSQRGEYATDKLVKISGSRGEIEVRMLTPFRDISQVELSLTDCHTIGIDAPFETEAEEDAASVTLAGPSGEIERQAAIVARRHLHCNPAEAKSLGIADSDKVSVEVVSERGKIRFDDIEVRIKDSYQLRVQLDTDEGNAAGIKGNCIGKLIINKVETTQIRDTE